MSDQSQGVLHDGASDAAGSRGGNVRSVQEARDLQTEQEAKRDWSGAIDEQIRVKLVGTATVHANDLDGLGVPPEHLNLIGTRMARYCNKGWMEPTTERRKVTHPAANGRKNPVYRITPKGWQELTAGVSAGDTPLDSAHQWSDRSAPCADPGGADAQPAGTPDSQDPGRRPEPVPSACERDGSPEGVEEPGSSGEPERLFTPPPLSHFTSQEAA